jgi:hypothetical protein
MRSFVAWTLVAAGLTVTSAASGQTVLDMPATATPAASIAQPRAIPPARSVSSGQGRLRVAVNRPDTTVTIDGVVAGPAPLERDVPAGIHTVRVSSPFQKNWEGPVNVRPGVITPLRVYLRPAPDRTGGWSTLGVALGIFVTGSVFGVLSNVDRAALDAARADGTLDNHDARIDRGTAFAATADVTFILGGIIGVIGIYMLAHDPTEPSIARVGRSQRLRPAGNGAPP